MDENKNKCCMNCIYFISWSVRFNDPNEENDEGECNRVYSNPRQISNACEETCKKIKLK
jgi:hypothetical protein